MKKKVGFSIILIGSIFLFVWNLGLPENSIKLSDIVSESPEKLDIIVNEVSKTNDLYDSDLHSLPTTDEFSNLSAQDVHFTPSIIKDGGELIGRIHSEAQEDPSKRSSALKFFKLCAEDSQIATPIRAVCLKKVYKLIPVWRIAAPLSEDKISKEVLDLANKLL